MAKNRAWVIGTRKSKLALVQAQLVRDELKTLNPGIAFEIKGIKTTGDKTLDVALSKIQDKRFFTKEIEEALLKGEIDLAVHSMKDLPVELPNGLKIGAVTKREDPRDVLVSRQGHSLNTLPSDARVGTSSLRRLAQVLYLRKDLQVLDLRGNLDTRIRKLEQGLYDAIVLAYAGIKRLGIENKITPIPVEDILPQAGQGALAIEIRANDQETDKFVEALNDFDSLRCVEAERALLLGLGGGCQVPIGVCARVEDNQIFLKAGVFSLDGKVAVKDELSGEKNGACRIGTALANNLLKKGAKQILDGIHA